MRLTLRTLLAYMDDILDPADHEDLGKKIEASDFAAELIHRSRDTVRRLRLGAPEVLADESDDVLDGDPAADANAVAEYLDNTLPPEQVADFERCCLDTGTSADMHLAEVTSCHHILTMVLGEPAEIDPVQRRRMYDLPERLENGAKLRIEPSHTPVAQAEPLAPVSATPPVFSPIAEEPVAAAPAAVAPAAAEPVKEPLPDYLRVAANGRRRNRRLATAAILALLGAGTVYLISSSQQETKLPTTVADAIDQDQMKLDISVGEPAASLPAEPTNPEASGPEQPPAEVAASVAPPFVAEPAATVAEPELPPAPPATDSVVGDRYAAPPADDEAIAPLDNEFAPARVDPADSPEMPAELALTDEFGDAVETPAPLPDLLGLGPIPGEEEFAEAAAAPPEPVGPIQLGTYAGNNDVLLRYAPATQEWVRLPPRTVIAEGDTLLSLPKYRTHIALGNVNAYLSGGTQISLPEQAGPEERPLQIDMSYGKLMLNAGLKGCQLAIRVGEDLRECELQSSASLAVDVHRVFIPGSDYNVDIAPVEADWYLTTGSVEWKDAAGATATIRAPATWKTVNDVDDAPQPFIEPPRWIDREPLSDLERRARDRFAEELVAGRPVELRLQELNQEQSARREVKMLSAEASLYVGEFEPFVNSLNDSDQRIAWRSHIEAMRQAMARNPQVAEQLHEALIRLRGRDEGEDLLRMIVGFSPEEIGTTREEVKQGVVIDLIRWLEHPSLDYRVLAIYNLDEIKGTEDLKDFRPDGLQRSRSIAVAKIRQLVEDNEFLPVRN